MTDFCIIIDIDNLDITLEQYKQEINYKLNGYIPSWIIKTDKGFHVGFILDNPIWLNNSMQKNQAEEIKRDLTLLLNGDIAGSHRLVGYWRNPLTHISSLNLELHNIDELQEIATNQYFESFSLFDEQNINNIKSENRTKNKKDLAKSNWEQIDKTGFTIGNRNNFLFNKVIGMLHNGLINNNQVEDTLISLNAKELDNKEINILTKSIIKYDIKPSNSKILNEKKIKGIYHQELWDNQIHNYKDNNKTIFARQQIGQKISTAKIIQSTIMKLIDGYFKIYKNHDRFINDVIVTSSGVGKRTVQRYRNERRIEKEIKLEAFKRYIQSLLQRDVIADDTSISNMINSVINYIEFEYKRSGKVFKFKIDMYSKLIFYSKKTLIKVGIG